MSSKTIEALKRADRAMAGACLLILVTAGAAFAYNSPYSEKAPVHVAIAASPFAQIRPMIVVPSPAQLAMARLIKQRNCLAEAIYYEARGEGLEGQEAVAEVVLHRVAHAGHPGTICGVVYEGSERRHGCQFSFTCNGDLHEPRSPHAWARAQALAARIIVGALRIRDMTGHAMFFHAEDVQPDWADTKIRTGQIGHHIFYREPTRSERLAADTPT